MTHFLQTALVLALTPLAVTAQQPRLTVGDAAGADFSYDARSQYVVLSLADLTLPATEDNSSGITRFLRRIFTNRKDFGLVTAHVRHPGRNEAITAVLFSYERSGRNRYRYGHAAAGSGLTYALTEPFLLHSAETVEVDITIREWEEDDAVSPIKSILNLATTTGALPGPQAALTQSVTQLIAFVESLYPPDNRENVLQLRQSAGNLVKTDRFIQADGANFLRLRFETRAAFFSDFDLEQGLTRSSLRAGLLSWRDALRAVDDRVESDGIEPLRAVAFSFAAAVGATRLNARDQTVLLGCAITGWAPKAVAGVTINNETRQFRATTFNSLPNADLSLLRRGNPERKCDFQGTNCETQECMAFSSFLNKGATRGARKAAAAKYLDGELTVDIDGSLTTISAADFEDAGEYYLRSAQEFDKDPLGPNSWQFRFEDRNLALRIKGKNYFGSMVSVFMVYDPDRNGGSYVVTSIEIKTA